MMTGLAAMRSAARPKRVWIVDDDHEFRAAVGDLLQGQGFVVVELANGRDALELLISGKSPAPSLILLDMEMPKLHGSDFLTIVRSYYRLRSPPVLVLAGRDHSSAIKPGSIEAYLLKPYDPDQLVRIVRSITAQAS